MPLHSRLAVAYTMILPLLWSGASFAAGDTYTDADRSRRNPAETMPAEATEAPDAAQRKVDRSAATRGDAAIARAVEKELQNDPLLSLEQVRVQARDGTVLLNGEVDSLMAKERATHVAEAVKNVIAVRNDIAVAPEVEMTADQIETTIHQALLTNPATEAFDIAVEADRSGVVTLVGDVQSWAEKELAGRVAKGVVGVTEVRNIIDINQRAARADPELQAELDRLLRWDAYIEDDNVEVLVERGVVRLSGEIPSAAERRRTIALAWMTGAKDVQADRLEVNPDAAPSDRRAGQAAPPDREIAQAVRAVLRTDPQTDAPIEIEASGGAVTLRGAVDSLKAKRAIVARAANVEGVREVRERLRVASGANASAGDQSGADAQRATTEEHDQQIAKKILAALSANPVTEAHQVAAVVDDGVATLTGQVDSFFERGTADDVAAGVRGVREVVNDLIVADETRQSPYDPFVDSWSIHDYDWYTPQPGKVRKQDAAIIEEIEQELAWSPFVDANEVQVSVSEGVATLQGRVDSMAQKQAATENALEGGASRVLNRLRIGG